MNKEQAATELNAANLILQRGVKVQVAAPLFFRIFGRSAIVMEVKALTIKNHVRGSRKFLEMGIQNTGDMSLKEAYTIYSFHAKKMSEIVALSIPGIWPYQFRAKVLRDNLTDKELSYLYHLIVIHGGIQDFLNTIRLIEATRITKPMNLSPEEKMS